jgi:hypothetical protein
MTNRNGVAQNVAPRTTVATIFAGVIRTMRLGQKMSEDVSITDLIAEARQWAVENCSPPLLGSIHIVSALADALEAVTVPTENEREYREEIVRVLTTAIFLAPQETDRERSAHIAADIASIVVMNELAKARATNRERLVKAWQEGAEHGARKCDISKDGDLCPSNPYDHFGESNV